MRDAFIAVKVFERSRKGTASHDVSAKELPFGCVAGAFLGRQRAIHMLVLLKLLFRSVQYTQTNDFMMF